MAKFKLAEVEVIRFETEDVIVASGGIVNGGNSGNIDLPDTP